MSEGQFECVGHGFLSSQNIRGRWYILACVCLLFSFVGCSTQSLRSIAITPAAGTETLSAGQSVQYKALGAYVQGIHPANILDITSLASWSSSNTSVATANPTGLVTGVGPGTAVITASATGQGGVLVGSSDVTVTGANTANQGLTSITILPGTETVTTPGQTVQFIAIGNYGSAPITRDLTGLVNWSSSVASVATINSLGLATYLGGTVTTIIASYAPTTSSPVTTATAALGSSNLVPPSTLPTLTIYMAGHWTSPATVTAEYTGPGNTTITPITCTIASGSPSYSSSTNSLCTGSFPVGTSITVSTPNTGTTPIFGGWSSNCTPVTGKPYSCTITVSASTTSIGNYTVGAIFD